MIFNFLKILGFIAMFSDQQLVGFLYNFYLKNNNNKWNQLNFLKLQCKVKKCRRNNRNKLDRFKDYLKTII
jgi:hypothetical protein